MLLRIERLIVDTEHEREIDTFCRRRDQHVRRPCPEMLSAALAIGEATGRLEDSLDAERLPRQFRRILLAHHLYGLAAHIEVAVLCLGRGLVPDTVDRVVPQQVRERIGVREVVHRHELERSAALDRRAHDLPTDSSKPVDADPKRHAVLLWVMRGPGPHPIIRKRRAPPRTDRESLRAGPDEPPTAEPSRSHRSGGSPCARIRFVPRGRPRPLPCASPAADRTQSEFRRAARNPASPYVSRRRDVSGSPPPPHLRRRRTGHAPWDRDAVAVRSPSRPNRV